MDRIKIISPSKKNIVVGERTQAFISGLKNKLNQDETDTDNGRHPGPSPKNNVERSVEFINLLMRGGIYSLRLKLLTLLICGT